MSEPKKVFRAVNVKAEYEYYKSVQRQGNAPQFMLDHIKFYEENNGNIYIDKDGYYTVKQ